MRISDTQSDVLNLTRWVAAWFVVAEHARSLMFADYAECGSSNLATKGFYILTGFGHEAVMIFFVISGYLVGGKVWSKFKSGTFAWKPYLVDRISRLYAVVLVALILGGIMDWVGALYFDEFGLYSYTMREPVAVVTKVFSDGLSIESFFGNLLFLQTVSVETFGSNGPLWSLANEWWYYCLFPLLLGVCYGSLLQRLIGVLLVTLLLFLLPTPMLVLFGVWLLGVVASIVRISLPVWLSFGFFVGTLTIARTEVIKGFYLDKYLIGVAFALWLLSLAGRSMKLPGSRFSTHLADFSYSTYLLHFPFLVFGLSIVFTVWGYGLRMNFGLLGLAFYLLVMIAAIAFSYLVARVTEARTDLLRARMRQWCDLPSKK